MPSASNCEKKAGRIFWLLHFTHMSPLSFFLSSCQRPTAKELLKHKLIVRYAKKTSYLTELIDRYKRWKAEQSRAESSSDESDSYAT